MAVRNLVLLWVVVLMSLFLSSCAFNLFAGFELDSLLSSNNVDQKLAAAKNALSSGDYDKALALAGSILNQQLNLSFTNEQLKKLLDSTNTVYEFAQALYDKKDELTDKAIDAVKILIEAAATKSGKSLTEVTSDLLEIAQELGLDLSEIFPKSKNGGEGNFWQTFETVAGTAVSIIASFMDNGQLLKLLTSGYYALATATHTADSSPMYAGLCAWYDLMYIFNLILDLNNDGKVTDEPLVKATITKPASFTELISETTSGLYQDQRACDEFVWAYEIMDDVLEILKIDITLPTTPAAHVLRDKEKLSELFELLGGEGQ